MAAGIGRGVACSQGRGCRHDARHLNRGLDAPPTGRDGRPQRPRRGFMASWWWRSTFPSSSVERSR